MLIKMRGAYKENQNGFTLVEIAIVLVIVGLLVGSFIGTVGERIDVTRRADTKQELEDIKKVVMAYAYTKTPPIFLPCPDITVPPDGEEDRVAGACTAGTTVGRVPWKTLGVGHGDAWGTRYEYRVNPDYSVNTGFNLGTDDTNSAHIHTRANNALEIVSQNAVAVIFSRGKNGLGGISIDGVNRSAIPALGNGHDDEIENSDANQDFISRFNTDEGVTAAGGAFDDILIWITSYELKAKMVEAGKLP